MRHVALELVHRFLLLIQAFGDVEYLTREAVADLFFRSSLSLRGLQHRRFFGLRSEALL
jgi:hypothetical protein